MSQHLFSGTWHNTLGSEMNIEVDASGSIKGKFRTAVGRPETAHIWKDRWFDVVGFVNGDSISLAINYAPASGATSVISGTLQVDGEQKKIEALSYTRFGLAKEDKWREVVSMAQTFVNGPAPKI